MEPSSEQKLSIERLYENESLTDNLTDADAKAVLKWAQEQILQDKDGELVRAAVSTANASGQEGAQALVAQAANFLAQELQARATQPAPQSKESASEITESVEMNSRPMSAHDSPKLGVSGKASEQGLLTANADATIGSATSIAAPKSTTRPTKKSRAKSKRKKKRKQ